MMIQDQANAQLKEQLREQVQQAVNAARDAAQAQREAAIAARDAARAGTLAPGGAFGNDRDIPPRAESVAYAFFATCAVVLVLGPFARAIARRLERGTDARATFSPQMTDQLNRIEQSVEAMAIEVERISESQRFMARLQAQSPASVQADRPG
jgi:hypothetical protein